ncbi:MAG: hypothetical protein HQL69_22860 [Magnetococcales bacterium]|nr:hypothetical protein [Magnetococcales bacterium]
MASKQEDMREVIVEVRLPPRHVKMQQQEGGRSKPVKLVSGSSTQRAKTLDELHNFLATKMHLTPTILKAAGAIVVRASGHDVQLILKNPLVKAIRPNRKLP